MGEDRLLQYSVVCIYILEVGVKRRALTVQTTLIVNGYYCNVYLRHQRIANVLLLIIQTNALTSEILSSSNNINFVKQQKNHSKVLHH